MGSGVTQIDHIKEEIKKTGFPIEMELLSLLNSRNWFAIPNEYYFDPDLNIARSIDIRATPYPFKTKRNFTVHYFLAIECKKSELSAWVFFETKFKVGWIGCDGQYADYLKSQNLRDCFEITDFAFDRLKHYTVFRKFSTSYTEVKLKKAPHNFKLRNETFEAVNQVVKYVSYEIESYLNAYRQKNLDVNSCLFFFPIIVFDGELYTSSLIKDELVLKKANRMVLTSYYKPRYAQRRLPFKIDIVKREYFPSFLEVIEKEMNDLTVKMNTKSVKEIFMEKLTRPQPYTAITSTE